MTTMTAEEKKAAAKAAADKKAAAKKAAEAKASANLPADATNQSEAAAQVAGNEKAAETQAESPKSAGPKSPAEGTKAFEIWKHCTDFSETNGRPISMRELVDELVPKGESPSTLVSEYQKWRKFNGITGRVEDPETKAKREEKSAKTSTPRIQREPKIEQNGVKRPYPDTKCGAVWELADKMSTEKGAPVDTKDLVAAGEALGMNRNNIIGEFFNWRKFYGITTSRSIKPVSDMSVEALTKEMETTKSRIEKLTAYQKSLEDAISAKQTV